MSILAIVIAVALTLIYFLLINPKIKYFFWILGIIYWNNPYFFSIVTNHFRSSIDLFFLAMGVSVFFIPTFFIVSSIQTIISVFLDRDYIKILTSVCLILFTLLYYKDVMDVSVPIFDLGKCCLRIIILVGTIFLFFKKEAYRQRH